MSSGQPQPPQAPIAKTIVYICTSCGAAIRVGLVNGRLPASMQCAKCKALYSFQADQSQQNPLETWTPERVENLIKLVDTLASKYVVYKRDEAEADHRWLATGTRFNTILTTVLSIFLAVIVALMSYLTLEGKVSGDALLFLAGTITGYILLFVQRLTKGIFTTETEAEEAA